MDSDTRYHGAKMEFDGNILYCSRFRTVDENIAHLKRTLAFLYGVDEDTIFLPRPGKDMSIFEEMGDVKLYKSSGEYAGFSTNIVR